MLTQASIDGIAAAYSSSALVDLRKFTRLKPPPPPAAAALFLKARTEMGDPLKAEFLQQQGQSNAMADPLLTENPLKQGKKVPCVLSVAGSDSGGGAGIQADMKACAALGVYCTTAITAVTAQNTVGVQGIHCVPEDFVEQQLQSVLSDFDIDVVKTGMLPSSRMVKIVATAVRDYRVRALVVDPVMVATSGDELVGPAILGVLCKELLPLADLVTPNIPEASALIGGKCVSNIPDMREAAAVIHQLGPRYVLVKGGHLTSNDIVDILYDGKDWHELHSLREETHNTHGTGCTLASSIAAELAKGAAMLPAILAAKEYLSIVLKHSKKLMIGKGPQGPLNHLYGLANLVDMTNQMRLNPRDLMLYAVTDSDMNRRWHRSSSEAVRAAVEGGATIVQLREKEAESREFLTDAEACVEVAHQLGVRLLINDRLDIAMACNADGVHLGQSDMPVSVARAILGPKKIIGVSCKTPEQAQEAWKAGADYIGSGGVYPTKTKKDNKTIGLSGLYDVCKGSPLPVVAIGGISAANVEEILRSCPVNLFGVAVVSCLFDQPDIRAATANLHSKILKVFNTQRAEGR
ncbi:hypothetical protein O6H91_13G073900 [Diphasiastrum complanatum]|uniref:Uncharacterized protein n=3 Tax=Diphasiastrum complanatum TaxID=34168 RepID=A0ACC2BW76_DIPCM|nr:hypothetical protein O6H91_13G073900 [Diphasiastrum complanatum]KAJ7533976.1 hypothetical protein O6H91_13G073900 [Diphasiastrum complanatum]KAJ7533977.1 hypothetical protein O6H91_13G073900 [Diphasiastrum complanatum]